MGHEQVLVAVVVEVAGVHPHARLGHAHLAERRAGEQAGVAERAVALVDPEQVVRAVVGDVDVDPPVAVEVGGGHAEGRPETAADERGLAHVDEAPLPRVAVQVVRGPPVGFGRTVVARVGQGAALDAALQRVVHVVADVEIEPAVAVVVDEGGRYAESSGRADAPLGRRLGERAVAAIDVQLVRAVVGQEQVGPAVVVHVARRHAQAIAVRLDAAVRGDVGEAQPPRAVRNAQVVAEQPARERSRNRRRKQRVLRLQLRVEHPSLHQVDVEIAVVVEVEEADAGRNELRVVEAARGAVEVDEVETGRRRLVDEPLAGRQLERRGTGRAVVRAGNPVRLAPAPAGREKQKNGAEPGEQGETVAGAHDS